MKANINFGKPTAHHLIVWCVCYAVTTAVTNRTNTCCWSLRHTPSDRHALAHCRSWGDSALISETGLVEWQGYYILHVMPILLSDDQFITRLLLAIDSTDGSLNSARHNVRQYFGEMREQLAHQVNFIVIYSHIFSSFAHIAQTFWLVYILFIFRKIISYKM